MAIPDDEQLSAGWKRRQWWRVLPLVAAGFCTLLALLLSVPVAAHTSLLQTDPPPNGTIDHSPDLITLHFDQALQPGFSTITVYDASQRPVKTTPNPAGGGDPSTLTIGLPKLATGTYAVVWQVLSPDGHVVRGAYAFTVALPGDPPPALVTSVPQIGGVSVSNRPSFLAVLLRGLRYGGIAALVGGIGIFLLGINPALAAIPEEARERVRRTMDARLQRWLFVALGIALGAHLFSLLVQVATVNGVTLAGALNFSRVADLIKNTTYGAVWRMQGILLLCLGEWLLLLPALGRLRLPRHALGIVASPTRERETAPAVEAGQSAPVWGWAVALAGGLLLLLVTVFGGHAIDVVEHPALVMLADWAHLTAMSLWFGGLILLVGLAPALVQGVSAATQRRVMAAMIGRFSHLALASIAILTATGIYAATTHTTRDTLATTAYGLVLLGKIGLVVCIVAVAAMNRFLLERRIARDPEGETASRAQRLLLRGMTAEVVLGVAVIALTGLLTQLPPANTRATSGTAFVTVPSTPPGVVIAQPSLEADGVRAILNVETKGQDDTFDVRITDTAGNLLPNVTRVMLWLNSGDQDVGVIKAEMLPTAAGHYQATGQWFAIGENWLARVVVRRQDVAEDVQLPFALQPRPTAYTEEPISASPFRWPRLLPGARPGIDLLGVGIALLVFIAIVGIGRAALRRATRIGAVALVVLGLVLIGWYSTPTTPLTGRKDPLPATQDVVTQGGILYAQNCAACHGVNGAGNGRPGTQLTGRTLQGETDGDLYWAITNGVGNRGMPGYTTRLSPTERWQIVRYLRSIAP